MKAMVGKKGWISSCLEQQEVKMLDIKDHEVLIKVCAVGVNRGDVIDVAARDGVCPGLECSGIIEAVGSSVSCWKVGERVCAVLEGGGYAEQVAVPANCVLPLSDDIDLEDAASLPYASCSIWLALCKMCDPQTLKDKKILIHEGTSGMGALAIQYAKNLGLEVIASTGSSKNFLTCQKYGAHFCVDLTATNVYYEVTRKSGNQGVDFVLDYCASDLERNILCCRKRGNIVIVDLHGNKKSNIDLALLQEKHIGINVFDLRSRDLSYKANVIAKVRTHLWPYVLQHKVIPIVDHRFPITEAQKALNLLKKNDSIGKITLYVNFEKTCTRP